MIPMQWKRKVDLEGIRRRLKVAGVTLPSELAELARAAARETGPAAGCFHVVPGSVKGWRLGGLRKTLVPFLRLGDGGLVCLGARAGAPAIVWLGSEGETKVVGASAADFLARVRRRKTGVPDIDDARVTLDVGAGARLALLGGLQRELDATLRSAAGASPAPNADRARKRLHALAKTMVSGGVVKLYKPRDYWQLDLRARTGKGGVHVTVLDYGAWKRVPKKYAVAAAVAEVLELCKRRKPVSQLIVTKEGLVQVNGGELVLAPPP